ncbi:MAG: dockerin type I repeat-containing protein [Planctomycetales bacterium]|nr:dockerin type I repeat-containing protein [Planctomycetales bacterium]
MANRLHMEGLEARHLLAGDFGADIDSATQLTLPAQLPLVTSESFGDVDWFRFEVEANTRYAIGKVDRGDGGTIYLTLYDSQQQVITETWHDTTFLATATGTYYLSSRTIGTSAYSLAVEPLVAADTDIEFGDQRESATKVTVPFDATGTLSGASDEEWLELTLEAGNSYRIDVQATDGTGVAWSYFAANAFSTQNGFSSPVDNRTIDVLQTSKYFLMISPSVLEPSAYSRYRVNITKVVTSLPTTQNSAASLEPFDTRVGTQPQNQSAWFKFEAKAFTTYWFETENAPRFVRVDSDGGQFNWASREQWTATKSGTVWIRTQSDATAFTYQITLIEDSAKRTQLASIPLPIGQWSEPTAAWQEWNSAWFAVETDAQQDYRLRVDSVESLHFRLTDPQYNDHGFGDIPAGDDRVHVIYTKDDFRVGKQLIQVWSESQMPFKIRIDPLVDDIAAPQEPSIPYALGSTSVFDGRTSRQTTLFRFTVQAGHTYVSPGGQIEIIDSRNALVTTNCSFGQCQWQSAEDDVYYARTTQTLQYVTFYVNEVPDESTYDDPLRVRADEFVNGTFQSTADVDAYTLAVEADTFVTLQVENALAFPTLSMRVFDSNGSEVIPTSRSSHLLLPVKQADEYTIVLTPTNTQVSGYTPEYRWRASVRRDEVADPPEHTALTLDNWVSNVVNYETNDADAFTFSGLPNHRYLIEVRDDLPGTQDIRTLSITDESGRAIVFRGTQDTSYFLLTSGPTGAVNFRVVPSPNSSAVFYRLRLSLIENTPQDEPAGAIELLDDDVYQAEFQYPSDADWFKLHMEPNLKYLISFVPDGRSTVRLYSVDNPTQELSRETRSFTWTTPVAQDYYLQFESFSATGPYELRFAAMIDREGSSPQEAQSVPVDRAIRGVFDQSDDEDWYLLSVAGGVLYDFVSQEAAVNVISQSGEQLTPHADTFLWSSEHTQWWSDRAQNVYLRATPGNSNGDYRIDIDAIVDAQPNGLYDADKAPYLASNTTVRGEFMDVDQQDVFRFQAEQGTHYQFQITSDTLIPTDAVPIRIRTPLGSALLATSPPNSTGGLATLGWRAPASGDYLIDIVHEGSQLTLVDYELSVLEVADEIADSASSATALITNSMTSGSLESTADQDWYRISTEPGHSYHAQAITEAGEPVRVQLFAGDGATMLAANYFPPYGQFDPLRRTDAATWDNLSEDTMYVVISAVEGRLGAYYLIVEDGDDVGDDRSSAATLHVGTTAHSLIGSALDVDYFRVDAQHDVAYEVVVDDFDSAPVVDVFGIDDVPIDIERVVEPGRTTLRFITPSGNGLTAYAFYVSVSNRELFNRDERTIVSTWVDIAYGDVNLDGHFNSSDLVRIFQAGEYEDDIVGNSTWRTGDWNGDGDFTTQDLVIAFANRGYENE